MPKEIAIETAKAARSRALAKSGPAETDADDEENAERRLRLCRGQNRNKTNRNKTVEPVIYLSI